MTCSSPFSSPSPTPVPPRAAIAPSPPSSPSPSPHPARRALLILCALGLGMLVIGAICPFIGPSAIDGLRVLGLRPPDDATEIHRQIFLTTRLPRVLLGLVAGAVLALAGAVFQAVLRNDLATPYTLGVSGGACVGALLVMRVVPAALVPVLLPVSSFALALAAVTVIFALAHLRGPLTSPSTLVLAGVTLNLLFGALILLIQYLSDPYQTFSMIRWLMGGLDITALGPVAVVAILGAAGGSYLVARGRTLNLLSLGEVTAAHLGVHVERTRLTALVAASLITAAVVAYCGPIGFVGLIVPHTLRRLVGPDHRVLLMASALAGAGFLVLCDTAARTLLAPIELPVGVVTSFLGAPFFLWILFRKHA